MTMNRMHEPTMTLLAMAAGVLSACGGDDPAAANEDPIGAQFPDAPAASPAVLVGAFNPLPGYTDRISGRATLFRSALETRVSLQLVGLLPGVSYPTHLHQMPCAQAGGGHYKMDPAVEETLESNEIWPPLTIGDDGTGAGEVVSSHLVRGDALSIVVHDPLANNAKLACADLTLNGPFELSASGELHPFAGARSSDESITGQLTLQWQAGGVTLSLNAEGLDPSQQYDTHVHAQPCGVMDGAGHYKIDPSQGETVEANELWPHVEPNDEGVASDVMTSSHAARLDAQSVVIHRVIGDESPKVACANLRVGRYPDVETISGALLPYAIAGERGYDALSASASLMRRADGTTAANLSAAGLEPGQAYPVHVHALPCGVNSGGGHYKLDPGESETIEANEIWLPLSADADGAATAAVELNHLARAEAQSIVIHDYEDAAKLACLDLR